MFTLNPEIQVNNATDLPERIISQYKLSTRVFDSRSVVNLQKSKESSPERDEK